MPTRLDKHANIKTHSEEYDKPRDADRMDRAIEKNYSNICIWQLNQTFNARCQTNDLCGKQLLKLVGP